MHERTERFRPTTLLSALAAAGIAIGGLGLPGPVRAQEVYVHAGVPGIGIGLGHRLGDRFGVRVEGSTLGTWKHNYDRDGINYDSRIKSDMLGLYLDAMVAGPFRVTGGVSFNNSRLRGTGTPTGAGTIRINNYTVPYGPGDSADFSAKFSSVAPYLGIGYGHHSESRGWGFIADLGVFFGRYKVNMNASPSVEARIGALGGSAQAEIEGERQRIQKDLDKYRVLPVAMIGATYRW